MSLETGAPGDMLAAHPETAYFWGRVAGDGDCEPGCVTVRTSDETAARRLAAVAGAEQTDHRIVERAYAHDTSLVRREEEYTVQVLGELAARASGALGLPFDGEAGGYRFGAVERHDRELLRGVFEACAAVCCKTNEGTVGISFVHEDERLLRTTQTLLGDCPVDIGWDSVEDCSSGYWFGVDADAVPALAEWIYEESERTGLFAPSRRRKLRQSLERDQ
jgi:hypothetical protein